MALTPQTIGLNMSHGFSGNYATQQDFNNLLAALRTAGMLANS